MWKHQCPCAHICNFQFIVPFISLEISLVFVCHCFVSCLMMVCAAHIPFFDSHFTRHNIFVVVYFVSDFIDADTSIQHNISVTCAKWTGNWVSAIEMKHSKKHQSFCLWGMLENKQLDGDKRAFGSLVLTSIQKHNYTGLFNLVCCTFCHCGRTCRGHLRTFNLFAAKSNTKYCSKVPRLRIVTNAKGVDWRAYVPCSQPYLLDQNNFRMY